MEENHFSAAEVEIAELVGYADQTVSHQMTTTYSVFEEGLCVHTMLVSTTAFLRLDTRHTRSIRPASATGGMMQGRSWLFETSTAGPDSRKPNRQSNNARFLFCTCTPTLTGSPTYKDMSLYELMGCANRPNGSVWPLSSCSAFTMNLGTS